MNNNNFFLPIFYDFCFLLNITWIFGEFSTSIYHQTLAQMSAAGVRAIAMPSPLPYLVNLWNFFLIISPAASCPIRGLLLSSVKYLPTCLSSSCLQPLCLSIEIFDLSQMSVIPAYTCSPLSSLVSFLHFPICDQLNYNLVYKFGNVCVLSNPPEFYDLFCLYYTAASLTQMSTGCSSCQIEDNFGLEN